LTQWSTVQGFPSSQSRSVWQDGGGSVVVVLVVVIAVVVVTQSGPGPQQPKHLSHDEPPAPASCFARGFAQDITRRQDREHVADMKNR
jgi:hypothetical protein